MERYSALLTICVGNSPVPGEFPAQGPVTRSFDVFFDLRLNKRLSKQSWGWWFETLSRPLCAISVVTKYSGIFKFTQFLWKDIPRYWPFVCGIHRSPVNSPHKDQWRGALMFSLICVWINGWVNNREAGDLRLYRAHYAPYQWLPNKVEYSTLYGFCGPNPYSFLIYNNNNMIMTVLPLKRTPLIFFFFFFFGGGGGGGALWN